MTNVQAQAFHVSTNGRIVVADVNVRTLTHPSMVVSCT